MYKIREQRLKDFYTTGETQSELTVRKTKTHAESIGDQGSFLTMKTKEIRDSESPTRDISCVRRGETWRTDYDAGQATSGSENFETQQISVPADSVEVHESSMKNTGQVSSQRVTQSSSVQSSKTASQSQRVSQSSSVQSSKTSSQSQRVSQTGSVQSSKTSSQSQGVSQSSSVQSSKTSSQSQRISQSSSAQSSEASSQSVLQTAKSGMEVQTSGNSQRTSGQIVDTQSGSKLIASEKDHSSSIEGNQMISSSQTIMQGGQQSVTSTRTVKQSRTEMPQEIVTTTVTTYTTSDSSEPVEQKTVRVVKNQASNRANDTCNNSDVVQSAIVESQTLVESQPKISKSVTESVTRNQQTQQSHQTKNASYSTQSRSVTSSVQQSSTRAQQELNTKQTIDNRTDVSNKENTISLISGADENQVLTIRNRTTSNKTDTSDRDVHTIKDQKSLNKDRVQITEVDVRETVDSLKNQISNRSVDDTTTQKKERFSAGDTTRNKNEQVNVKSASSTTDQKIMNEIQKLDSFLSTQPTPSSSVPMSPQGNVDTNWPVDREFVYTDNSRPDKIMVNGDRATPVKYPSNLDLPKGATDGQYLTTYQHDYSPRISRDHDTNHQYFASTLRASPDRSSPSPSKRSSSKGSLDRSTPDRKFRASPSRKTPDHERRLSSSSYTIERIPDNKRYSTDVTEKSQTLPKDSKPKRKFSSTQTKVANKTRVSTPGASPTTSPVRIQRARKPSSSDSDSDHSNATFNKSSLKKTDLDSSKKYGSTNIRRGSSTSVNITDNESRILSSPSPTRYPARENTPDYSSEGSITRELRTARNIEKASSAFDSSPERSAFAPIKSFRTSPEKKDISLNMINEERRNIESSSDVRTSSVDNENIKSNINEIRETRKSIIENIISDKTDSSSVRKSKDRSKNTDTTENVKNKKATPSSSPDRKVNRSAPQLKSESNRRAETKTPVGSPERRSPAKSDRGSSDRKSPVKRPLYNSTPGSHSDAPKTKFTEKTPTTKKVSKPIEGDRITRRSSIPRAETKYNSPGVTRPSFTRDTTSSATRTSTIRATSPAVHTAKSSVTKSVDRVSVSQTKDQKTTSLRKPDTIVNKRPIQYKPSGTSKVTSPDNTKPKTLREPKKVTRTKTSDSADKVGLTKSAITSKNDRQLNVSSTKTKSVTESKDIIETERMDVTTRDNESSIEDEQPPEFFDDLDDRDETDEINITRTLVDSTDFKERETDHSISRTCETDTTNKKITDYNRRHDVRDDTKKFISSEQKTEKTQKQYSIAKEEPRKKHSDTSQRKKQTKDSGEKKAPTKTGDRGSSSSSSSDSEEDSVIRYDDYTETAEKKSNQVKITKRDVSKESDKSRTSPLKVTIQQPKSPRESIPEKSIPMTATSDGGQTPRYADFVIEPEDVDVFDASNLGPNRPIQSTIVDENRISEERDDSTRDDHKVSVAQRVSKYTEKTNKVDIVTLDTTRQQQADTSDISRTKELFEQINKQREQDNLLSERRGSRKFDEANDFILSESRDSVQKSEITDIRTVDKAQSQIQDRETNYKTQMHRNAPVKKQSEDVLKKSERRLSEHSPDIEQKKAFFEKKSKEALISETAKDVDELESVSSSTTASEQKIPNYMKDTATAVTRKETIQREFAPVRQGTETDLQLPNREKRGSIDIDTIIKSEIHNVGKDAKPSTINSGVRDTASRRRSSVEIQQLDTFKKREAFITCEQRADILTEKRKSIDTQKTDLTQLKKKSPSKSPEVSPARKVAKEKPSDRVPLRKKDTNIMNEENVTGKTRTGKFGVALRRTSSGGTPSTPKLGHREVLPEGVPQIEEIFDLQFLEILVSFICSYVSYLVYQLFYS